MERHTVGPEANDLPLHPLPEEDLCPYGEEEETVSCFPGGKEIGYG